MRKEIIFSILLCVSVAFFFFWPQKAAHRNTSIPVLRIYNWAAYLPKDVIQEFEKQEKVRVQYDVFENLEALEAKLLAARSGYDVVFPAAWPTCALFIPPGAFSKIDLKKIPNARFLDPKVMAHLGAIDPQNEYMIPYLWGTTGLIYNLDLLEKIAPGFPKESWGLIYDKKWLAKIAPYKVTLLDSPSDTMPNVLAFLGLKPTVQTAPTLRRAAELLIELRPLIYKFDSSQVIQDMLSGNVCVAEAFSSYANIAIAKAQKMPHGPRLVYVLPKEGALMWIDVLAIPKDAPHKELAHKFINFLLQPKVMARITNEMYSANAVPASKPFINPEIANNPTINPPLNNLYTPALAPRSYERLLLRLWTKIKTGY